MRPGQIRWTPPQPRQGAFHQPPRCRGLLTDTRHAHDRRRKPPCGHRTLENVIADNQKGQPGYEGYLNNRPGATTSRAGPMRRSMNRRAGSKAPREMALPKDFYSSRYYVDRMIGWLDADKAQAKPFFSVVSLQANHYPHQAPKEFIDRYLGR